MTTQPVALVLVAALIGSFASPLEAQSLQVKAGTKVVVTTTAGWEMKGVVSDVSDTTIDVSGETGTKRINVSEVRKIDTSDSLRNGFFWGLGLSAGAALIPAFAIREMNCPSVVTGPGQCTYPKTSTGQRIGYSSASLRRRACSIAAWRRSSIATSTAAGRSTRKPRRQRVCVWNRSSRKSASASRAQFAGRVRKTEPCCSSFWRLTLRRIALVGSRSRPMTSILTIGNGRNNSCWYQL